MLVSNFLQAWSTQHFYEIILTFFSFKINFVSLLRLIIT